MKKIRSGKRTPVRSTGERRARRHPLVELLAELLGILLAMVVLAGALAFLVKNTCEDGERACRTARVVDAILSNIRAIVAPDGRATLPAAVPESAVPATEPATERHGIEYVPAPPSSPA